jgi:hypothetical protein
MNNKNQRYNVLFGSLIFIAAAICILFAMKTIGSSGKEAKPGKMILGGGGLQIVIDKKTENIVSIMLQK